MTLDDVERLLDRALSPEDVFGKDLQAGLRRLEVICHPDRNLDDQDRAKQVFQRLHSLAEAASQPPQRVKSPKRTYAFGSPFAVGDVADVYAAQGDGQEYVLKISRVPGGEALLDAERAALTAIHTAAADTSYRLYYPLLVESFPARGKFQQRVNVFSRESGLYTLEQIVRRHTALDAKHIVWMFRRLLVALGFAHRQGYVHGAVLPQHLLYHPENHGLQLVGWGQSVEIDQPLKYISAKYRHWYPSEVLDKRPATAETDVYLAAKCMVYAAGLTSDMLSPGPLPGGLVSVLRACLMPNQSMRHGDAWRIHDDVGDCARRLYGPPKFHPLSMS